ncbi:MAG: DNA polymerase III subunit beta [Planctomycetes bacterium GWA2_39_15]|nr:MAG: DNA polymerase III subunit beta [Planctomycetes bacterium GWA2_39_15]
MNLSFNGNELYKGFNLVTSIVPSSAIKHILQGIRFEVVETGFKPVCTLTATDLEVLVKYTLSAKESVGNGSIVLPAVRVNNILREWAGNEEVLVSFDVETGLKPVSTCVLKSGKGYFKIVGEDSSQFPMITITDVKSFVTVDGKIIGDMIGKVVHAASTVRARSTLCGVFVKIDKEEIVMAAADGNRLSMVKRKVENPDGVSMSGIVSVKCLTFLQRFSSEFKGILRIGIGESQVLFVSERGEVVSQLIDGQYPRYEDVIPKDNDKRVEVKRDELITVVRMASFMTSEGYHVVKFVFKDGRLTLMSKAAEVGEAELEIDASYKGPDFEICFNPEYVLDALKVSDSETVVMELKDNSSAALFRTGHEQLSVIMPIELK